MTFETSTNTLSRLLTTTSEEFFKLKEEWWGPSTTGIDECLENKQETSEENRESKMRESISRDEHVTTTSRRESDDRHQRRRGRTEPKDEEKEPLSESSQSRRRQPRSPPARSRHSERRRSKDSAYQSHRPRSPHRSRHYRRSSSPRRRRSPSPISFPPSTAIPSDMHSKASLPRSDANQIQAADQTLTDTASRTSPRSHSSSSRSPPFPSRLPLRPANALLFESVASIQVGLRFPDFEPFLMDEAIDPLKSFAFYRMQIEFFVSISSPIKWSNKPHSSVFIEPNFVPLQARIMSLQPNLDYIRTRHPLGHSTYTLLQKEMNDWIWDELGDVLDWIYDRRVQMNEILWFVEHVPRPLLALARVAAIKLRYSRGVSSASTDFIRFLQLQHPSDQSTYEKEVVILMGWIREGAGRGLGQRWKNWWGDEVKRDREGRELKGKRWLDEVKGWRTVKDLEEWEKDLKAQGKWRTG